MDPVLTVHTRFGSFDIDLWSVVLAILCLWLLVFFEGERSR